MRVPEYYSSFKCLADRCRDSCCVGWELDIDEESYQRYCREGGPFGDRLRAHMEDIEEDGEVFHTFRRDGRRCPFLNDKNLCDICLELGEDALCVVCTEYPRYTISFCGRLEHTLTLSCEEAARLQFEMEAPLRLVEAEDAGGVATAGGGTTADDRVAGDGTAADDKEPEAYALPESDLFLIREQALAILQDRARPIDERFETYLAFARQAQANINEPSGGHKPSDNDEPASRHELAADQWFARTSCAEAFEERIEILGCLEILDEEWQTVYDKLASYTGDAAIHASLTEACRLDSGTDELRARSYEHLAAYFTLRYFPQAAADGDVLGKARFCLFCLTVIRDMESLGIPLIDCVRIFCKEVEHSDDNIAVIMEELLFAEYN